MPGAPHPQTPDSKPPGAEVEETPYRREPGYALRYRDRRFAAGSGPTTHRRESAALAMLLRDCPPDAGPWLDVPSGAGRLTPLLPGRVVQVDRDAAMLRACPADAARARACASALHLPFADRSFAGVLCMRLLQHLPTQGERERVLGELARVSRGPVLFSYFEACSLPALRRRVRRSFGKTRSGRSAVAWRELRASLAAAGLRPVRRIPLLRWLSEQTLVLATRLDAVAERSFG